MISVKFDWSHKVPSYDIFLLVSCIISIIMLIWACVEVGGNDGANLVNAVCGASILNRRTAVYFASFFVICGALCSGSVMETVRKGIFDVELLSSHQIISVFIASYFVNTVILFVCSCYGLPVSTTATLVFSLAGGSLGVFWSSDIVHWDILTKVGIAMLLSILMSGICGFSIQRLLRKIMGADCRNHVTVMKHGGWIGAFILSMLSWFLLFKGFHSIDFISNLLLGVNDRYLFLLFLFLFFFTAITVLMRIFQKKISKYLFDFLGVIGMSCMAFAFGQNDLANCASPGLAILMIALGDSGSSFPVPWWYLFLCGVLMSLGMQTKRSQRVTRAEIDTASQQKVVNLYAPRWCKSLVKWFSIEKNSSCESLDENTSQPYDPLRACVVLTVSASVIVLASSFGLPVSTTYVSFAAVVASGWGDRIFSSGSAEQKLGRALWVVTCWVLSILAAIVCTAWVAYWVDNLEVYGLIGGLTLVVCLQIYFRWLGDKHEKKDFSKQAVSGCV